MSVQTYKDGELQLLAGAPIQMKVMAFPGQIVMGANIATPTGWLKCDGTAYSQVDYPLLFAAIGTQYNAPDTPEGQFCVPDMRGRYALGASATEPVGEKIAEQLPNIRGDNSATFSYTIYPYKNFEGAFIPSSKTTLYYGGSTASGDYTSIGLNAQKTIDPVAKQTIDNPAYKDPVGGVPVKVRPDSMTLNYYIKY